MQLLVFSPLPVRSIPLTMKIVVGVFFALLQGSLGFVTPNKGRAKTGLKAKSYNQQSPGRRSVLEAALLTTASTFLVSAPVFADVSDGNTLPQGAAQFQRVLKVRNDLVTISKRVTENAKDIDKKEWDNIGQFLRRLYAAGDDMRAVSSGIFDPTKKSKAEEDIKLLQKYAKAGEGPVNKQDGDAFIAVMDKSSELISDFLEQLRDVPDEI